MDAIAAHFGSRAVVHHGERTPIEKQAAIDRFKDDPKCTLFIGGITLAIGYSAASADLAIMGECSWVPGENDQAEKRLDDVSKTNSVLIQYVCFDGSLDARQLKRNIEKQDVIQAAIG
jgi:SNF2 family DNA or RNA helicase